MLFSVSESNNLIILLNRIMVYINNNKMYDISTYIIGKFEVTIKN